MNFNLLTLTHSLWASPLASPLASFLTSLSISALLLLGLTSCGVKGPPRPPPGTEIPPYIEQFTKEKKIDKTN